MLVLISRESLFADGSHSNRAHFVNQYIAASHKSAFIQPEMEQRDLGGDAVRRVRIVSETFLIAFVVFPGEN